MDKNQGYSILIRLWKYRSYRAPPGPRRPEPRSPAKWRTCSRGRTTISNINVKTGDSYTVSYKCNKRLVPKIRSTGDTLTISQSKGANYKRNTTSEITVTIPEGTALNKLSLDTGVGEVNLNSLTASDAASRHCWTK